MVAFLPLKFSDWEILAKTFIISAGQNQFIRENIFNNAPVRRTANAMNTKSAFIKSYFDNPCWREHCVVRQTRTLRVGQAKANFDAAENCRFCVTTAKAMNFQADIISITIENFKDHFLLVFHLTSVNDSSKNIVIF